MMAAARLLFVAVLLLSVLPGLNAPLPKQASKRVYRGQADRSGATALLEALTSASTVERKLAAASTTSTATAATTLATASETEWTADKIIDVGADLINQARGLTPEFEKYLPTSPYGIPKPLAKPMFIFDYPPGFFAKTRATRHRDLVFHNPAVFSANTQLSMNPFATVNPRIVGYTRVPDFVDGPIETARWQNLQNNAPCCKVATPDEAAKRMTEQMQHVAALMPGAHKHIPVSSREQPDRLLEGKPSIALIEEQADDGGSSGAGAVERALLAAEQQSLDDEEAHEGVDTEVVVPPAPRVHYRAEPAPTVLLETEQATVPGSPSSGGDVGGAMADGASQQKAQLAEEEANNQEVKVPGIIFDFPPGYWRSQWQSYGAVIEDLDATQFADTRLQINPFSTNLPQIVAERKLIKNGKPVAVGKNMFGGLLAFRSLRPSGSSQSAEVPTTKAAPRRVPPSPSTTTAAAAAAAPSSAASSTLSPSPATTANHVVPVRADSQPQSLLQVDDAAANKAGHATRSTAHADAHAHVQWDWPPSPASMSSVTGMQRSPEMNVYWGNEPDIVFSGQHPWVPGLAPGFRMDESPYETNHVPHHHAYSVGRYGQQMFGYLDGMPRRVTPRRTQMFMRRNMQKRVLREIVAKSPFKKLDGPYGYGYSHQVVPTDLTLPVIHFRQPNPITSNAKTDKTLWVTDDMRQQQNDDKIRDDPRAPYLNADGKIDTEDYKMAAEPPIDDNPLVRDGVVGANDWSTPMDNTPVTKFERASIDGGKGTYPDHYPADDDEGEESEPAGSDQGRE